MTITMTSSNGLALVGLQTLLAASATFQAKVAAADAAAALKKIHIGETPYENDTKFVSEMPFGYIVDMEMDLDQYAQGVGNDLLPSGLVSLYLCDVPQVEDVEESYKIFTDYVGNVIDEMAELNGTSYAIGTLRYYTFSRITKEGPSQRTALVDRKLNDYFDVFYFFRWGFES